MAKISILYLAVSSVLMPFEPAYGYNPSGLALLKLLKGSHNGFMGVRTTGIRALNERLFGSNGAYPHWHREHYYQGSGGGAFADPTEVLILERSVEPLAERVLSFEAAYARYLEGAGSDGLPAFAEPFFRFGQKGLYSALREGWEATSLAGTSVFVRGNRFLVDRSPIGEGRVAELKLGRDLNPETLLVRPLVTGSLPNSDDIIRSSLIRLHETHVFGVRFKRLNHTNSTLAERDLIFGVDDGGKSVKVWEVRDEGPIQTLPEETLSFSAVRDSEEIVAFEFIPETGAGIAILKTGDASNPFVITHLRVGSAGSQFRAPLPEIDGTVIGLRVTQSDSRKGFIDWIPFEDGGAGGVQSIQFNAQTLTFPRPGF